MSLDSHLCTHGAENVTRFLLEGKPANRAALLFAGGAYSYGEVQSASDDVVKFLLMSGGRKGDRVIVASENSFFWVSAYLGILDAGMVCVPLAPNLSPDELRGILHVTEPRFAFLQAKFATKNLPLFQPIRVIVDSETPALRVDSC